MKGPFDKVAGLSAVLLLLAVPLPQFASIALTGCVAVPTATIFPTSAPTSAPTPLVSDWQTKTLVYDSWWGGRNSVLVRYRIVDGTYEMDAHPDAPSDTTYYNMTSTYDPSLFLLDTNDEILTLDVDQWVVSNAIMGREEYTAAQLRDAFTAWRAKQTDSDPITPYLGTEIHLNADGTGFVFYTNWRALFDDSGVNGEVRFHDLTTGRDVSLGFIFDRIGWAENGMFYGTDHEYNLIGIDPSTTKRTRLVNLGGNYGGALIANEFLVPHENALLSYSLQNGVVTTVDTRFAAYEPVRWIIAPDPHWMLLIVQSDRTKADGDLALYRSDTADLVVYEMPDGSRMDGADTKWIDSDTLRVGYRTTGSSELHSIDVNVSDFQ